MTERLTTTVKWYRDDKGYGFLNGLMGSNDVFVHASALEKAGLNTLKENERVEYELAESRGKLSAVNLKKVA